MAITYRGERFSGYNKPKRTPGKNKKFAVLAKVKDQIKLIRFGDPNMAKSPKPKNPALYARVKAAAKRKFKVWPSAYASAWVVREYKKRGGKY
jgi:hypothetical protein